MKTSKIETSKMKTSINLKTSKMKNKYLKLGMMAAVMLSASIGFAQTTTVDIAKQAGIINGTTTTGGTVKVIDNKGTIKYLQVANGITSLTNITSDVTTTTFQLGGTLTDNTYIDATGKVFALDGIALATGAASTDAVGGDVAQGGTSTGTGWTLLVRDEATGATQKLKLADLITSAYNETPVDAAFIANPKITFGSLSALPTELQKTWVYRNGVKLRSGVDYTIATNEITITPIATAVPAVGDWALYVGDYITVQVLSF
jgi:hypothetical protein